MLQLVNCKSCHGSYMVGIMEKDVRKTKLSGGRYENTPYVAVGNGELDQNPTIKEGDRIPCPNCGKICTVLEAKPIDKK